MTKTIALDPSVPSPAEAGQAASGPAEPTAPAPAPVSTDSADAPKPKAKRPARPVASVSTRTLVARIRRVADRHMAEIEARLPGLGSPAESERESRTLARLARLVRELAAAEEKPKDKAGARRRAMSDEEVDDDAPPRDIDAFRDELARRLERLRQARSGG